jgi:RNA-splicing ligase RtcB
MKIVNGIYASAKIFSETAEDYAIAQIQMICDNEASKGSTIRVMPDVHPGKVGVIGLTMETGERILPSLVGIDIGCGISMMKLKKTKFEPQKLDAVIQENIPSGFGIRKKPHHRAEELDLSRLRCYAHIRPEKAILSLGTLGGDHFIEIDKDEDKNLYAVVHTGSRHLGKEVTEYYLREGQAALKAQGIEVPYELTWLDGRLREDYLHDLQVVQEFAEWNRQIILQELTKGMKWKALENSSSIHNYIDLSMKKPLLRKGAISAKKGEAVIIPINMRDGILLGTGLGNEDWNCSAPHGSGRVMSREKVKESHTVSEFKKVMKGIYSSCIGSGTLDEAPFAYRSMEEIADAIGETVTIDKIIRPVYNFKAGSK